MRVTLTSGARTYDLWIGPPPAGTRIPFASVDELADFFRRHDGPDNQTALSTLQKNLLGGSAETRVRTNDADPHRRLAQAFHRSSGVVVDVTPKPSGGGGGGGPAPVLPAPVAPKPAAPLRPPENETPLTEFEILEVTFLSDHDKLKDHAADWKNQGKRFPKPEWRAGASSPASHSHLKPLDLKVKFRAGPPNGRSQPGELVGRGGGVFRFDSNPRAISPGEHSFTLRTPSGIPFGICRRDLEISWTLALDKDGRLEGGATSHTLYCTYDAPQDDKADVRPEDGVTVKRMETAVDLGNEIDSEVSHKVVSRLMDMFEGYSLAPSKEVPDKYRHPSYLNNGEGGAWAMAQFRLAGECQAIVRFVWGVIRQIGLPGDAQAILVYAHPSEPRKALFHLMDQGVGLGDVERKEGDGVWLAALADKPVQVGQFCLPPGGRSTDGSPPVGFNSYEACLQFTSDGETVYYAGGVGGKSTLEKVLHLFHHLVWIERVKDPVKGKGFIIRKIEASYKLESSGAT